MMNIYQTVTHLHWDNACQVPLTFSQFNYKTLACIRVLSTTVSRTFRMLLINIQHS